MAHRFRSFLNAALGLWLMTRPLILLSVVLVFALGLSIAHAHGYPLDGRAVLWGLAALLLVTVSIHYVNEYADFETDSRTQRTPFSGGSGALPRGLLPRAWALVAAWAALGAGVLVALNAAAFGQLSWLALPVLLVGAWGGWMYSLPPLKLAWRGWGEATNAVLGGLVLPLYGFVVAAGELAPRVLHLMLPFTLLTFLNLLATTWADRHADAQVGKYTLATRWHIPHLRRLYSIVALAALLLLTTLPPALAVLSTAAIPLVVLGALHYTRRDTPTASVSAMVVLLLAQLAGFAFLV